MRSGRSHSVGFFVLNSPGVSDLSSAASDFWFQMILGIEEQCRENNYFFGFDSLNWDLIDNVVHRALSKVNDGAIIIPQYKFNYSFLNNFKSMNYPFVMYNPWLPLGSTHSLHVADREAQDEIVSFLIRKGHKAISLVNGPSNHIDAIARYEGYKDAHNRSGIPVIEERVVWSDFTFRGGYESTKSLLNSINKNITAIVCSNDYLAVGAMQALSEHGLKVPDDIAVTGFGGHDVSQSTIPRLTTMVIPTREIGKTLGNKLFCQIFDRKDKSPMIYHPTLLVGGST